MWIPAIIIVGGWLGYKAWSKPKHAAGKLDTNLTPFQKVEVYNALKLIDDPQALHVMAMSLQQSPIAGNALEEKSQYLQKGGTPASYVMPDFDFN